MDTEGNEASVERAAPRGRLLMIFVSIVTMVALAPVAGMVLAFAILPALPIVLAIALVLGPINWLEDRVEEAELRGENPTPWTASHGHTHAHA